MTVVYDFIIVGNFTTHFRSDDPTGLPSSWTVENLVYECQFCFCCVHQPERHWAQHGMDEPVVEGR